jgi:glucan biosynthesis protein C
MHHLWYLFWLCVFSVLTLPCFLHLRSDRGRGQTRRFAALFSGRVTVFLLALPIGALSSVLDPETPLGDGYAGWPVLIYLVLFIYGFLLFSDERFSETIQRNAIISLTLAVVSYGLIVAYRTIGGQPSFGSLEYVVWSFGRALNSWFFVLALLGLGSRYLNFTNGRLRYLSEGSLPYYMLHQTLMVVIAHYFIREMTLGILPELAILLFATLLLTMLLYEACIRRFTVMRMAFGLARRRP